MHHLLFIAFSLLSSAWCQDASIPAKVTGIDFDMGTFVHAHYYTEHYLEQFGVWPIDEYYLEPTFNFTFPASALDQIPAENKEDVATFKENGELYGEAVRRFKSPPYARFFTLGGDNVTHTVGDGRLNETSLRDEMTYASFVSDDMGFGLFAAKNISAGTPLGIYTGIVREHIRNTDYSWEYNIAAVVKGSNGETVELSVDALLAGNNMRFVNHAHNSDDLNVEQRYIPVDGVWYVMYITTDDVRMHDQLWVSYGDEYWKVRKMKEEDDEEE